MGQLAAMLRGQGEKEVRLAWRRYAELLREDQATPQSLEDLRRVASTLNRTHEQVEEDQQTLHEIRRLRAVIKDGRRLESEVIMAENAVAEHTAETQRIIEERRNKLASLRTASSALQGRRSGAIEALASIRRLKQQHAGLLCEEPEPSDADLA